MLGDLDVATTRAHPAPRRKQWTLAGGRCPMTRWVAESWASYVLAIPLLVHRPPTIGFRWGVQFVGYLPFVGLPIMASTSRGSVARTPAPEQD